MSSSHSLKSKSDWDMNRTSFPVLNQKLTESNWSRTQSINYRYKKWRSRRTERMNQKKYDSLRFKGPERVVCACVWICNTDRFLIGSRISQKLTRISKQTPVWLRYEQFFRSYKKRTKTNFCPRRKIRGKIRKKSKCQSNCIQILYFYLLRKERTCKLELPIDVRKKITKNY